ncbi:hypothetical protein BJV74DRAFT_284387 [Russula compacta]|nr:hypothetical protein BJV74DRAFT_284387 [Russula compacta]
MRLSHRCKMFHHNATFSLWLLDSSQSLNYLREEREEGSPHEKKKLMPGTEPSLMLTTTSRTLNRTDSTALAFRTTVVVCVDCPYNTLLPETDMADSQSKIRRSDFVLLMIKAQRLGSCARNSGSEPNAYELERRQCQCTISRQDADRHFAVFLVQTGMI